MLFTISLYISLALFAAGVFFKVSTWFRYNLKMDHDAGSVPERMTAAVRGMFATIFSADILTLLKALVVDVLFQFRILREDFLRWLMHMCIYAGFMGLLLMHALESIVTARLFPEYYATVNPFFFLRDCFGTLVILGIGIAMVRRMVLKVHRLKTEGMDLYAIIILAVIMGSGFLLEGTKITSYSAYEAMVEDYASTDDEEELKALESAWVQKFSVVSPNIKAPFDEAVIEEGLEIHEESCVSCHASPQWAFGGFITAKILSPAALMLDAMDFSGLMLMIHYLACFVGLAYLPFSKLFHIITTPLSLLTNAVMDRDSSDAANIDSRQVMELEACTRCGTCSLNCSVAISFEEIGNANILPSIKLDALKAVARNQPLSRQTLQDLQEGLFLCTNCYRCTTVCPSGINLQDLWFNTREVLLKVEAAEPSVLTTLSYHRGLNSDRIDADRYQEPVLKARKAVVDAGKLMDTRETVRDESMDPDFRHRLAASLPGESSNYCFACTTCTASCPVVRNFENPLQALGMLPHQMIRAANFGLGDMVFDSTMLWSCLGCYACQDSCPQGVKITDIFYELKNLAMDNAKMRAISA